MQDFKFLKGIIEGRNEFLESGTNKIVVEDQFDSIFEGNFKYPIEYYFKISIEDFKDIFREIDYEYEALTDGITYRLPQNPDGTYKGLYLIQKKETNNSLCSLIKIQDFKNDQKYIDLPLFKTPDEIPELTTLLKKNLKLRLLLWKIAECNFEKRYSRGLILEERIKGQKEKIEFYKAMNSTQRDIKIAEDKLKNLEDKLEEEKQRFEEYADNINL